MSKNLEDEYKKMILTDIPDLWDRIDAGISSQETTAPINNPENSNISYIDSTTKERRKKNRPIRYSGWIAAVICLTVVIPAAVVGVRTGLLNGHMGDMESAAGAKPQEVQNDYEAQNDTREGADEITDEMMYIEEEPATVGEPEPVEQAVTNGEDGAEAASEDMQMNSSTVGTEELQKEKIITGVSVTIQAIDEASDLTYEVIVEDGNETELLEGAIITLVPANGDEYEGISKTPELEVGGTYQFNLYPMQDGTYLIIKVY